jgi:hypothetical protein
LQELCLRLQGHAHLPLRRRLVLRYKQVLRRRKLLQRRPARVR